MLTREEIIFLIVCLVNLVISICYLLWGVLVYVPAREIQSSEEPEMTYDSRKTFVIRFIIMVFCPVVGSLFFLMGFLTYKIIFHQEVDLEDVIFSKERVRTHLKADEEIERNMASLEESIAVSDKKNLRTLMMNVIREDIQGSLSSVALALNSKDSETSHYAASALQDEWNEFRLQARRLYAGMEEEDQEATEYEELLMDYLGGILRQKIFTGLEQRKYVQMLEDAGERLYAKDTSRITASRYEGLILSLLELEEYEKTELWCDRLAQQYPDVLETYTCRLKLYYQTKNREAFFRQMEELKKSGIPVDRDTLEIIRVFN